MAALTEPMRPTVHFGELAGQGPLCLSAVNDTVDLVSISFSKNHVEQIESSDLRVQ